MPKIPGIPGPYWFFFYSFDCNEPMQVRRDRAHCKFWLAPVTLAWNHGFNPRELNGIRQMVLEYQAIIIEAWHEHCGQR